MVKVSRAWLLKYVTATETRTVHGRSTSPKRFFDLIKAYPVPKGGYSTNLTAADKTAVEAGEPYLVSGRVPQALSKWSLVAVNGHGVR